MWVSHCSGFSSCRAWALRQLGFSSCGTWAQLPRSLWDLPGPGIEPVSLHWQTDSQPLDHQGSPLLAFWISLSLFLWSSIFLWFHVSDIYKNIYIFLFALSLIKMDLLLACITVIYMLVLFLLARLSTLWRQVLYLIHFVLIDKYI